MNIFLLLLLIYLMTAKTDKVATNTNGYGCLFTVFIIIIAFILTLAWEHKVVSCILLLSIIIVVFVLPKINEYLCELIDNYLYKDESPKVKKERLETEKMIREWKRKKFF